jgi:hypothetical protein
MTLGEEMMLVDRDLVIREDGIYDLKAKPGQTAFFADNYHH